MGARAPTLIVPRGSKRAKPVELGSLGLNARLAVPLLWQALRVVPGRTMKVGHFS